jgi:hypothetical protein
MYGKKIWFFPDGERPPVGNSELIGHESYVVLNPNDSDAHLTFTIYFEDEVPLRDICVTVGAQRVGCFRTHDPEQFGGHTIAVGVQYAAKVESDVPVIIQYGRLDTRQQNMAFYTTIGYPYGE